MGNWFGCCGSCEKCSDALKCIDPEHGKYCYYRQNLEAGKVFYGKNRNIGVREGNEIFIYCFERLFAVKMRQKNDLSYNLTKEQFETVKTVFEAYSIPYRLTRLDQECFIDMPDQSDPTPANSRVYFKIDDMEFNLYNYNGYLIKFWRAEKIAKSLKAKGFDVRAEIVGRYSNIQNVDLPDEIQPEKSVEIMPVEVKQEESSTAYQEARELFGEVRGFTEEEAQIYDESISELFEPEEIKVVDPPVNKKPTDSKQEEKPRYKQMSLFDFERVG
jgi:hypothetical protein